MLAPREGLLPLRLMRAFRLSAMGLVLGCLVVFACGCELLALYAAWQLVDQYVSRDKGDTTTRIVYVVETSGTGNARISGARIELYALRTGGDPNRPGDYDTVPDAVRQTNESGEAVIYVKNEPNDPNDQVIRPGTTYRELVAAAGFEAYDGVRDPIAINAGLVEADPIRLVPEG